jgi:deoxyribose-phosphate aldolase
MEFTELKSEAQVILETWQNLDKKPVYAQPEDLAAVIDHTLLKPDADNDAVLQLCREAREHKFASVCVNPIHVPACCENLAGSDIPVCTVIGFPLGATTSKAKAAEAREAVASGAEELDMVLNVGKLKSDELAVVMDDVAAVVSTSKDDVLVKVILETCLLEPLEIVLASLICMEAGAHYVKTSTGFSSGGATSEAVGLMRFAVGDVMGVKASGGIRTRLDAENMLMAGATRLGASAGIAIVRG